MNTFEQQQDILEAEFLNKKYISKGSGPFEILFKINSPTEYLYRIKFLNTRYEKAACFGDIVNGNVFDSSILSKINLLTWPVYKNKNGNYFTILETLSDGRVKIRFLASKFERETTNQEIFDGLVEDFTSPKFFGIFSVEMSLANFIRSKCEKECKEFCNFVVKNKLFWQLANKNVDYLSFKYLIENYFLQLKELPPRNFYNYLINI